MLIALFVSIFIELSVRGVPTSCSGLPKAFNIALVPAVTSPSLGITSAAKATKTSLSTAAWSISPVEFASIFLLNAKFKAMYCSGVSLFTSMLRLFRELDIAPHCLVLYCARYSSGLPGKLLYSPLDM